MSKKSTDPLNFEKALDELEGKIEKMGRGELSLEDSLKYFEEGIALARKCQGALKEAEQKVQILIQQNDESHLTSFAVEE